MACPWPHRPGSIDSQSPLPASDPGCFGISLCCVYQGLGSVLSPCSGAGVCPLPGRPHSAVALEQDVVTQRDGGSHRLGRLCPWRGQCLRCVLAELLCTDN